MPSQFILVWIIHSRGGFLTGSATNPNEICKAVLSRSEPQLITAIETHLDRINEPSFLALRPLHLSVDWPDGIRVLLKYGATVNVTDRKGWTPVDHVIERLALQSLDLFEKAGCALFTRLRLQSAINRDWDYERTPRNDPRKTNVLNIKIKEEANRRRKLQSLLDHSLPECVLRGLAISKDRLLDQQASAAKAALKRHNVSIPPWLQTEYDSGTVYHYDFLTVKVLDILWGAGFRDVNELDRAGRTPLMTMKFDRVNSEEALEIIAWFENKGVDIDEQIHHLHQISGIQVGSRWRDAYTIADHAVVHYLCCSSPVNLNTFRDSDFSRLSKDSQVCLRRIVSSEIQDACQCACSSAGCQALHMIFKGLCGYARIDIERVMAGVWYEVLSFIDSHSKISNETVSEIVRFWTFEVLGLTHTCCRKRALDSVEDDLEYEFILMPLEREKIQKNHKKERKDLKLLKNLMVEFKERREQLGYPLIREFMKGYWWSRMKEVLSERKRTDFNKIREMGVVVHDLDAHSDSDIDAETEESSGRGEGRGRG